MRELTVVDARELAAAYAAAQYRVAVDGDTLPLRVGHRASDLEAYWPADCYTFLTAWNPASAPHSDTANEAADALLVQRLDRDGIARLPGWAEAPGGEWHEPGWVLGNLDELSVDNIGREFGQAAVLHWRHGQAARLRMLVERPRDCDPDDPGLVFTDWVDDVVTA